MNWDALGAIAELVGALAVVLTLAYLTVQVRQNSSLLSASNAHSSRDAKNEVSRILAADPSAARVFWAGLGDRDSLEESERRQLDALMSLILSHQDQEFILRGATDEAFDFFISFNGFRQWWELYGSPHPRPFRDHVEELLAGIEANAAQQGAAADSA